MSSRFTEVFVVLVMAAILLLYVRRFYGEVEFVRSDVDGRTYLVRKLPDRREAADMLGRLNQRLTQLVHHMAAKYPDDARVAQLLANYNPEAFSEGGAEVGFTSYTVEKGERVVMCLRQTDGSFVDENVLMYVAVHELGHVMTAEVGHTDAFWASFKFLLTDAIELGLYTHVDYAKRPAPYCGITVSSSVV